MNNTKHCKWCDTTKPIDEFGIIRDNGKGTVPTRRRTRCRSCQSLANRCVVLAPRHFGYESRSEALRKLPRKAVNDMHRKFQELLISKYGGFTNQAIEAFLADQKKKKGNIDIPFDESDSEELMQIILDLERKKNNNKQISRKQVPYGFVYGVWHPAEYWKGWVKVGRAGLTGERLSGYQTSDPHKKFELLHKVLVTNRFTGETLVLNYFRDQGFLVKDEWIQVEHAVFIDVLNWMKEDQEFNADAILEEYRLWKEKKAA